MMIKMMLTVDLLNTGSGARALFDKELAKKHWVKCPSVTTTWSATFGPQATPTGVLATARRDVGAAARVAGVTRYEAVCVSSYESPMSFNQAA